MTLAELKKLIAVRQGGEEPPLLDRLTEATRRPFRASEAPEGVFWYSLTEKPQSGDVVVLRLASGELVAGIYAEKAPRLPNYWEIWQKPRRISKRPPVVPPVIRHELRPLGHPHRKLKYTAPEVTGVYPIVEYNNIGSKY